MSEAPFVPRVRREDDQHVFLAQARIPDEVVGDRFEKRLLLRRVTPISRDDLDYDEIVGAVDSEILGIVDELVSLVLVYDLELVIGRRAVRFHQTAMDTA